MLPAQPMAVRLITWLDGMAMVPQVVMGMAREALGPVATALARLVGMVSVTLLRVVTPVVFTINMVMAGLTVETVTG